MVARLPQETAEDGYRDKGSQGRNDSHWGNTEVLVGGGGLNRALLLAALHLTHLCLALP